MKKFVVGYLTFFENELILHQVEANSDYEAVKKTMLEITSEEYKDDELQWQNSEDYPKTMQELKNHLFDADTVINVIEL